MKKFLVSILTLGLTALSSQVFAFSIGDTFEDEVGFLYEVTGAASAKVIGYEGTTADLVIPSVVISPSENKFRVTAIAYEAFKGNTTIESIVIPKNITEIPMDAFYGCTMLYKVGFEEGIKLEKINDYAFYNCTGLIDITIPTWYSSNGGEQEEFPKFGSNGKAFYNVANIIYNGSRTKERDKNYGWGARNINGIVAGYIVFPSGNTDRTEVMLCSSAAKGAIVVPETATYLRSKAFENCTHVSSVVLPASVTECGSLCFSGCTGLTSIICKATTPPEVNHYDGWAPAFKEVDKSIPVYVPEASIEAYKAANGWNQFTNYLPWSLEEEEHISKYTITLLVNDQTMGTVSGAGTYDGGSDVEISATPKGDHVFVQWNDGNVENPRAFKLTSDTTFTAFFKSLSDTTPETPTFYTLTLYVNDSTMGSVSGGGEYEEGSTVEISAKANEGYLFVQWSDEDTNPTRSIVMSQDTELTAIFKEEEQGIEQTNTTRKATKLIRNGQLVILRNGQYYNILGSSLD